LHIFEFRYRETFFYHRQILFEAEYIIDDFFPFRSVFDAAK
jgi:hypothetical protein